jgi:hypothetical protein
MLPQNAPARLGVRRALARFRHPHCPRLHTPAAPPDARRGPGTSNSSYRRAALRGQGAALPAPPARQTQKRRAPHGVEKRRDGRAGRALTALNSAGAEGYASTEMVCNLCSSGYQGGGRRGVWQSFSGLWRSREVGAGQRRGRRAFGGVSCAPPLGAVESRAKSWQFWSIDAMIRGASPPVPGTPSTPHPSPASAVSYKSPRRVVRATGSVCCVFGRSRPDIAVV